MDAVFYKFPERRFLKTIMGRLPDDSRFSFQVTDEITIRKFPSLPEYRMRAGQRNENFLNAELFAEAFFGRLPKEVIVRIAPVTCRVARSPSMESRHH